MKRSELHFDLPAELIAQSPAEPRGSSRLLVLQRSSGQIEHRRFFDLPDFLRPSDCLVLNDTAVLPARFQCVRQSGGRVEGLHLRDLGGGEWDALLKPSARLRIGESLRFEPATGHTLTLLQRGSRGAWRVRIAPPDRALEILNRVGQPPLPPYIQRTAGPTPGDTQSYQTVYAATPGAAAAPTAGLHFTRHLLERVAGLGVALPVVTLHVGTGTFAPIDADDLADHRMHSEWYRVPAETVAVLRARRAAGGRVVAVGTTSARVLESLPDGVLAAASSEAGPPREIAGDTSIFIYPPHEFRHVDALITNFHLPGSTLLALVMALVGVELTLRAYREAIEAQYRFYSYGDAMLVI